MVKICQRYSNKIESVGLRKCPYCRYLIEKVTSIDVRITNISQSLPHKMAENSWYEEITSLSPYVLLSADKRSLLYMRSEYNYAT